MSFLVIAGITVPVLEGHAVKRIERGGGSTRAYWGNLRSTIPWEARAWQVTTGLLTNAEAATLETAVAFGAQVECEGTALDTSGDVITCEVTVGDGAYVTVSAADGTGHLRSLALTLREVLALPTFRYRVGVDSMTSLGAVFSRGSTATYIDANGVVQTAAAGVARDSHYINGVRHLLLEGVRTNGWTWSADLDNAVWTKTGASVTANATTSFDGTATLDKLVEDTSVTAQHRVSRATPALTDNTVSAFSFFAKAGERTFLSLRAQTKSGSVPHVVINLATGAVVTTIAAGLTVRSTALANGIWRYEASFNAGTGVTTPTIFWNLEQSAAGALTYTGDGASGCYIGGIDFEADQPFASSYKPTTSATVTRGSDSLYFPYTPAPEPMTMYAKYIDLGTQSIPNAAIAGISGAAATAPIALLYAPPGSVAAYHDNGSGARTAAAANGAIRDTQEARLVLASTGAVSVGLSTNGGTEVTATSAVPPSGALATAWSGQRLYLIGSSAAAGYAAYRSIVIAKNTKSRTQMRALAA